MKKLVLLKILVFTIFFSQHLKAEDLLPKLKFTEQGMSASQADGFTAFKSTVDPSFCFAKLPKAYKGKVTATMVFRTAKEKPYSNMSIWLGNSSGPMVGAGGMGTGNKQWWLDENEKVSYHGKKKLLRKSGAPHSGNNQAVKVTVTVDMGAKNITLKINEKEISSPYTVNLNEIDIIGFSSWKKDDKIKGEFKDLQITEVKSTGKPSSTATPQTLSKIVPTDLSKCDAYHKYVLEHDAKGLPKGQLVLADTEEALFKIFKVRGKSKEKKSEVISVTGQPFTKAWKVYVPNGLDKPHFAMISGYNTQAVSKGDNLFLVYYYRTLKTSAEDGAAGGRLWVVPQGWKGRWQANQFFKTHKSEWQKSYCRFKATKDFAPKKMEIQFHLADNWTWKDIEMGGIAMVNVGQTVPLTKLPENPYIPANYEGREPDAQWRKDALARIEKIRKGNLDIKVVDANGKPLADAEIDVAMKKHQFHWGAAAAVFKILPVPDAHKGGKAFSPEQIKKFRYYLADSRMFNSVGIPNHLKWGPWVASESRYKKEWAMESLKWLKENNLEARGHVMHWGLRRLPKKFGFGSGYHLKEAHPEIKQIVFDHIDEEGKACRPYISTWDVVNEHFGYHDSTRLFGKEFAVEIFKKAREACGPDTRLFWNECRLTGQSGKYTADWIEYLQSQKAPLDGVGWQFHTTTNNLPSIPSTKKILDKFGNYGIDIEITEYDVSMKDPKNKDDVAAQTDFVRDCMILFYSHPSVTALQYWGWAYPAWKKNCELIGSDMKLTPAGKVWKKLVTETWWTDEKGKTGQDGAFKARGYVGDYEVTVNANGKKKIIPVKLTKDGKQLTIKLD